MGIIKCFNDMCNFWRESEPDHCVHAWKTILGCKDAEVRKVEVRRSCSFYVEELKSTECQCGEYKNRGRSVCLACWRKLPRDIQVDLYSRIEDGYEEAYEAAVRFLN